jgi:asparagine synthase (glutamine-hydrolysing)
MSGQLAYALEGAHHIDGAVGLERRYPFLDRRLAELCLSMPGDQKLRDGWTRSVMRRSLAGVLPGTVRSRAGKADLGPAFRRSLLTADRPVLEALVARPDPVATWVEPEALRALLDRCLTDAPAADCYALWRVAVLADWLARHQFTD